MPRYMIKTMKEDSDTDKYPNLQSKVGVTLKIVERNFLPENTKPRDRDRLMRKAVEKELRKGMFINPKYDLKREEEVTVYKKGGKVWTGEVKLPRKAGELSKELEERKYVKNLEEKFF